MKLQYSKAEVEIIELATADVIRTSGEGENELPTIPIGSLFDVS